MTHDVSNQYSQEILDSHNVSESFNLKERLDISNKNLGSSEMESCRTDETVSIPIQCNFSSLHEEVFDQILQMDDISQTTLIDSLNLHLNNDQVFLAGEGAGASGSFFFFSYD